MRVATMLIAILAPALSAAGGARYVPRREFPGAGQRLGPGFARPARNRPVAEQFRILDNGREQPIRFFAHEDAPVSLAVILDTSGSMSAKWNRARTMLAQFCENLAPGDEFFLVTVEQRPKLLTDYTSDCGAMQNRLLLTQPHGMTALLDAIPLAVEHLRQARHPRHAILIVSDGGENASRARLATIRGWREKRTRKLLGHPGARSRIRPRRLARRSSRPRTTGRNRRNSPAAAPSRLTTRDASAT